MNAFGPACPQSEVGLVPLTGDVSENCLTLNIWTQNTEKSASLPVMLFIHGGGFARGTGTEPMYNGKYLAQKGVVLVTINYRVNAFGFLAHPALTTSSSTNSSGNYGIMDQIFALCWIRENIRQFGGNPDNITIFGQSAGGASVTALIASPRAKGLFHRAIVQSGGYPSTIIRHLNQPRQGMESMESLGIGFSEMLDINNTDNPVKEMAAKPWQDIFKAWEKAVQYKISNTGISGAWLLNHLIMDGYLLERSPREIFRSGNQNNVPLMIGSVADEGTIMPLLMNIPTVEKYRHHLEKCFGKLDQEVLKQYPADNDSSVPEVLCNLIGDSFVAGARSLAYHMVDIQPNTYLYQFTMQPKTCTWQSPGTIGREKDFGCYHCAELPYLFHFLNSRKYKEEDYRFSEQVMNYWIRFARSGNPNGNGAVIWPAFDRVEEKHLALDFDIETGHHLRKNTCDFIDELDDKRSLG
jgi:para-nitrobenzyl esterase